MGVFASVILLVNMIGAIFFVIGLVISVPVTMLASVYVYRKLLAQTEANGPLVEIK